MSDRWRERAKDSKLKVRVGNVEAELTPEQIAEFLTLAQKALDPNHYAAPRGPRPPAMLSVFIREVGPWFLFFAGLSLVIYLWRLHA